MTDARRLTIATLLLVALALAASASPAMGARQHAGSKILAGTVDRQQNVGWIAAVLRHPSTSSASRYERQFCAGSLVAPDWVLTAAHCLFGENGEVVAPNELQIQVGNKSLVASGGEFADVAEVFVNPSFNNETNAWDAALLHLASDVGVQPVRIARTRDRDFYRSGTKSYIAGWGDRRAADDPRQSFPTVLYSAFIKVRSRSVCRRDWADRFSSSNMFCAGADSGRPDTCSGDSGGPIAVRRSPTRWRLTGITSYGRCGVPGNIGVYTMLRAASIQDWIRDTTGGEVPTSSTPPR